MTSAPNAFASLGLSVPASEIVGAGCAGGVAGSGAACCIGGSAAAAGSDCLAGAAVFSGASGCASTGAAVSSGAFGCASAGAAATSRSEEHTSELQSLTHLV